MQRLLAKPTLPTTLEGQVQYLMDRVAIIDVYNRFFLAVDTKNWVAAGECLADPFAMLVPGNRWNDPTLSGEPVARDVWVKALEERNAGWYQTLHMHPNELVVIEGDHASLGAYQLVPHSVGLHDGDTYTSWGFYDVELVRVEGDWRLEKITILSRLINNVDIAAIMARVKQRAADQAAAPPAP